MTSVQTDVREVTREPENAFAGQGSVLLDIGGDVGAVVVVTPPEMEGVEVEIRPTGAPHHEHGHHDHGQHEHGQHEHGHHEGHTHGGDHVHWPHVAVVNRPVADGLLPSLVFGEVVAGSYGLFLKGASECRLVVEVVGGEVTTADWPL